ncbi:hypothetical protein V5F44_03545 [Xanthobacter sp. V2C-8]|uniref:hypothetical protein n=1 Tax=Xanthobacter albus TaxID=3119929 RepID=UPI00372AC75F
MSRVKGRAGAAGAQETTLDAVNLDAVVLEQIFLSADVENATERLRRRRLLRRLLRRPAARIASRRLKRKRLLHRLDRQALGPRLRPVQQERRAEVRRALSLVRPARAAMPKPEPRPSRIGRWAQAGWAGRAARGW